MTSDDGLLAGRVVVITGAGRGIGQACALHIAGCGATVVVNDVDAELAEGTAEDIRRSGGAATVIPADLSDWAEAEGLIDAAVEAHGKIDGLVNNAALCRMTGMEHSDQQLWSQLVGVNILGSAACGQRAARYMLQRGRGAIVNVTSGAQYGMEGTSAYGATKGAVASLTYAWAVELRPRGVRVNALSPQAETRMIETFRGFHKTKRDEEVGERPSPAMNAPAVSFLLSDLACNLSGQILRVSGREIALVSHPAVLAPSVSASDWTAHGIATAFATQPSLAPQPLGLVGALAHEMVRPGQPGWAVEYQGEAVPE